MKKILLSLLTLASSTAIFAQEYMDRSNHVTLFDKFRPAVITLASGNLNHQREANVFMKKSTLVYMQQGKVMEANMNVVKSVKFGDRNFVKVHSQLAEVVDSCGENLLVVVRLINSTDLTNERLNSSTITNVSNMFSGDMLGITRMETEGEELRYPIDNLFYYIIDGKPMRCAVREVNAAIGKKRRPAFEEFIQRYGFSWSSVEDLKDLLAALSAVK